MYEILISNYFAKQVKRLAKKDQKLKEALRVALFGFNKELAVSIGQGVYKLRLACQGKGKSGGCRLYVYVVEIDKVLTPIAIYSKSEKENLTLEEMSGHLEEVKTELAKLLLL